MSALARSFTPRDDRNGLIAKIHVAKKELGLDDDTYRDVLERVTGRRSAKDCSLVQLTAVIGDLSKRGFTVHQKAFSGPSKKLVGKVRALWISGWNLGVINDPSDKAMEAFIQRQTGIPKAQWLKAGSDGAKVIDALKEWLKRAAGVDWKKEKFTAEYCNLPGYRICLRQWEMLRELGNADVGHTWTGNPTRASEDMLNYARTIVGGEPMNWLHGEWAKVSKALGVRLRKAINAKGETA